MEDNFEKQIKASMDNPPEYPFEERLWEDMNTRLNEAASPPAFIQALTTWLPLLLLLFTLIPTALATVFYLKHQSAMQRMTRIEELLQRQSPLALDTVVQRHVVIIYDTIYRPVPLEFAEKAPAGQNFQLAAGSNFLSTYNLRSYKNIDADAHRLADRRFPSLGISGTNRNAYNLPAVDWPMGNKAGTDTALLAESSSAWRTTMTSLATLAPPPLTTDRRILLPLIEVEEQKRRKNLEHYLLPLKPTGFSLSASLGTFTLVDNNANDGRNFISNLWGEIGYGDRLSLVIGIEHYINAFKWKIEDGNPAEVAGLPILPPDHTDDVLQEVSGAFHYAQIPFGVKYQLAPQNRLHPYLGLGLLSRKATISSLRFGYLSLRGEYSLSRARILPKTFELSAFWSIFGLQFDWTRHWSVLLEGGAQFDIRSVKNNYERSNLIRLSAGLQYQF